MNEDLSPITDLEWRWIRFYCHPCQVDELEMKQGLDRIRAVRDLISRAKASYRHSLDVPPYVPIPRNS